MIDSVLSGKTVLVTGASGFIGSSFAEALADRFASSLVVGTGRSLRNLRPRPNLEFIACDLLHARLRSVLPGRVDVVAHLAGDRRPHLQPLEFGQQMERNVVMTSAVADYAADAGAAAFLYASSVYVYSDRPTLPFSEDGLGLPVEHLGATKLAAEALLKARSHAGQFRTVALRIFTVYGPRSDPRQFVAEAIRKLTGEGTTAEFGPVDAERDFVFVEDVARAFIAAAEFAPRARPWEVFNVGSGVRTPVRLIVERLARIVGSDKTIRFAETAARSRSAPHQADISHAKRVLGWEPRVDLDEGLRRTVVSMVHGAAATASFIGLTGGPR